MGKRGDGEGSIYQRQDGRWVGSVTLPDGRRKAVYGATRQGVAAKLVPVLKAKADNAPLPSERHTVAVFLDGWLAGARGTVKPRTWARYETLLRLHAEPFIGKTALGKLTPAAIRDLYASRQKAGLSSTTVRQLHAVLHRACEQALRDGVLIRNVIDLVDAPRVADHPMQTLTAAQARNFLAAARDDRLRALYVLAFSTGMRQGELLALRWQAVDLDAGSLSISGTLQRIKGGFRVESPKTAGSRRRVLLTPRAVEALRAHRAAQAEERLKAGPAWHDADLIFASEIGTYIERGNLQRRSFERILTRAGLPRIRFHDLQHTAATLMLAAACIRRSPAQCSITARSGSHSTCTRT